MKPQIITQETAGYHNADLSASTGRITRGGSWKRQRIILIIPAADMIPARVYMNHVCLMTPPNQPFHRMLCLGQEVGAAYSEAIEQILAHPDLSGWEYIATLEHDNLVPCDGLLKLIERMEAHPELSAISGVYWTKGYNSVCQRWGACDDPVLNYRPQPPPPPGELGECCGIGMGFALWRMSMFKDRRIERPIFKTLASKEEGMGTQDLSFWTKARKLGYRCAVDAGVLVGHLDHEGKFGPPDMVW